MMKRFMFMCCLITTVLFLGVLLGMQQANEGMRKMKGYDDPSFKGQAFHVVETSEGLNGTFLGREITSQDIKEKQEKLEGIKAFNFFSSLGKKLANGVSDLMAGLLNEAADKVEEHVKD
ncbi:YqxA family protein [Sutcliffiella halmapala]|uniref:YqxA family protein n=1 Tax=Sutcliffiella halmapala TaxID=79882 RepID=UPI001F4756D2|nr:YqxA family protein [Sutcliffiella halmapala]